MIAQLNQARCHNLLRIAMGDELAEETWNFPTCIVVREGTRFACIMADVLGQTVRALAVPLIPRESVRSFRAKLNDGADPTVFDIAECGVVTPDKCEVMGQEMGGSF